MVFPADVLCGGAHDNHIRGCQGFGPRRPTPDMTWHDLAWHALTWPDMNAFQKLKWRKNFPHGNLEIFFFNFIPQILPKKRERSRESDFHFFPNKKKWWKRNVPPGNLDRNIWKKIVQIPRRDGFFYHFFILFYFQKKKQIMGVFCVFFVQDLTKKVEKNRKIICKYWFNFHSEMKGKTRVENFSIPLPFLIVIYVIWIVATPDASQNPNARRHKKNFPQKRRCETSCGQAFVASFPRDSKCSWRRGI